MLKRKVTWLDNFLSRHAIMANLIFALSVFALAAIFSKGINLSTLLDFLTLSTGLIVIGVGFKLSRRYAANLTYIKLLGCGALALLCCALATRAFYGVWFQRVLNGGNIPGKVKKVYDLLPMSEAIKGLLIKGICVAAGVAAVYALTVIFILALDYFASLSKKPVARFLISGGDNQSPKTIANYRIIGFSLLAFMVVVMVIFSSSQSLWYDEIEWSLGKVINKSFPEITRQLLQDGYNMPLYYYALAVVYRLVPYGEGYLSGLSIAFVVIGIIFLYFAAKKISGEKLAFITVCMASVSATLMIQGGWEIRPYAFYFCFSALTLWCYINRIQRENWKTILAFSLAMILLVFSHWFGALLLGFYGLSDLFLWIKRKIRLRCIVSYLLVAAALLPWFLLMLSSLRTDLTSYWADVPGLISIVWSFKYLLGGGSSLLFIGFAIGIIIGFICLLQSLRAKKWNSTVYLWVQAFLSCVWVIGATFIYSRFVNPEGSVFVDYYFFAVIPQAMLILALGIKSAGELIKSSVSVSKVIKPSVCFAILVAVVGTVNLSYAIPFITSMREPYRQTAEFFMQNQASYSDDTIVVASMSGDPWLDYYFLRRGYTIPNNVARGNSPDFITSLTLIAKDGNRVSSPMEFNALLAYDKVYYSQQIGFISDAELLKFLDEHYTKTWEDENLLVMLYEK